MNIATYPTLLGPLYYRPDTYDFNIIKEQNSYKRFKPNNKIVLDLGGNIGAFARWALLNEAKAVYSFEPEPANCAIYELNLLPGVHLYKQAAVGNNFNENSIKLYLNSGINKGTHSVLPMRNHLAIDVPIMRIATILSLANFEALKCDIEGGEFDLFENVILPISITELVIEYHFTKKGANAKAAALHEAFLAQGFNAINRVNTNKVCFGGYGFYRR